MKFETTAVIALLALGAPGSAALAQGESISFQLGEVAAKLHDAPCENTKVAHLLPRQSHQFRAADVLWRGQSYAACWAVVGNQIVVVDETGDAGVLSPAGFRNGDKAV
jgi:hypothetical protein